MSATETGTATAAADRATLRAGTGPGLVLLHGTGADAGMWAPMVPAWSATHTVVTPQLASALDTGPLTVAGLAQRALDAADDAGLEQFDLVGHSLGAVVAAELAATTPERVSRLVLHAGWVRTDQRMHSEFALWIRLLRTDLDLFLRYLPIMAFGPKFWSTAADSSIDELVATLAPRFDVSETIRQTELDMRVDITDRLAGIVAPTLVLSSRHDRLIDCAAQRALVSGIAHSTQAGLDVGHGAPAEDPAEFAAAVDHFLGGRR
ncbi:alpha/beta fold hydrolase [Tsukamurella sp. 8F]|uniref:alpha/beta fold hydrolase n=1 Tax=unclassified Tsukamurella TaxID=2633480 RepID=UPI0023B8E39C|nr:MULTISPECIES: alpha/beta fold hydrolase [unclassified Tsukamurella]MDF0529361.1 alpha/beta fold hydrolase [Tsukamurella sp. 8J]MDF0587132.1 alpha/beta fold hydrolase [Tsukamurella sp. 8F]